MTNTFCMKKIAVYFPIVLCCILSLAAVINFRNSAESWRFRYSLIGFSVFFAMLVLLIIANRINKNKR